MPGKGPNKNIKRLNEDLRRELIGIIERMRDPRLKGGLLTVTRVEATQDLVQCKVYVSVMGGAGEALDALRAARGHVRSEVSARMHIRKVPEFVFIEDTSAAYADHINKMLRELV